MMLALALAIVVAVVGVAVRGAPERAVASERVAKTKPSDGPLLRGESPTEPWRENARSLPTPEVSKDGSNPVPSGGEPEPGFAALPKAEPRSQSEPLLQPQPQAKSKVQPEPRAQAEPEAQPEPGPEQETLPVGGRGWTRPT